MGLSKSLRRQTFQHGCATMSSSREESGTIVAGCSGAALLCKWDEQRLGNSGDGGSNGVGDCIDSWAIDGQRCRLWHNGSEICSPDVETKP